MSNDKEWWTPIVRENGRLDWLCDHAGDYEEKITRLWEEYAKLKAAPEADLIAACRHAEKSLCHGGTFPIAGRTWQMLNEALKRHDAALEPLAPHKEKP